MSSVVYVRRKLEIALNAILRLCVTTGNSDGVLLKFIENGDDYNSHTDVTS